MGKKYFGDLCIDDAHISIFGSGNSINDISEKEIMEIKNKSFLITLNYAPVKISGHMNMWSDKHVSDWMNNYYRNKEKTTLFLARERSMRNEKLPLFHLVDYWFNEKSERLKGNYTIVWLLQLLEKYFPDKKVLLFGLDMNGISNDRAKWYDDHLDFDKLHRGKTFKIQHKLNQCARQLDNYIRQKDKFINCNLNSHYNGFERKHWKELLN